MVLLYDLLRGTVEGSTRPATLPSALQANPTSSLIPFHPIVVTDWEVLESFHLSFFDGNITDVEEGDTQRRQAIMKLHRLLLRPLGSFNIWRSWIDRLFPA